MTIGARTRIIYLVAVSVLAFTLGDFPAVLLLLLQIAFWFAARLPLSEARYLRKAVTFILVVLLFYAFFTGHRDFTLFALARFELKASSSGFLEGLRMSLRFVTVLLASIIVRHTTSREQFIQGLVGLRLPRSTAELFDFTLDSIEGKGKSGQAGKGKDVRGKDGGGSSLVLKRLLKGDFPALADLINRPLAAARERVADSDTALVLGLTVVVVSARFLKVVAGFPLAPGHKNLVIVPCLIAASSLTRTRYAATQIGFVSGVVNFLSGFGRFGVFDILQNAAPGLAVDALVRLTRRSNSLLVLAAIGLVAGLARAVTVLALALLFRMPAEFYVALVPLALSQCVFGALSAPISKYLVKNVKT